MEIKKTVQILILLANSFFVTAQQSGDTLRISRQGVGDIKIDITTLNDLKKKFPKCKVERFRQPIGFFWFSTAARTMVPENLGVTFFLERNKWFGPFYVETILMDSTFKGKTATGVGIGSTYSEITSEFGEERILMLHSINSESSSLSYDKGPGSITFKCNNMRADTNSFRVDWIYIDGW